ncbi:methyltransferase [Clostridium tetanomorphum]|nr:methyltransferase [Clostridium tetanomorphum]
MECYKDFAQIYDELIKGDINYKKWSNAYWTYVINIILNKRIMLI